MRVLFDESMPRPFAQDLAGSGHEFRTVRQMRWTGLRNGELLRQAAEAGFGALVSVDRSIEHQQNMARIDIGVIILVVPSNRIEDIRPLKAQLEAALSNVQPGQVVRVGTAFWKDRNRHSLSDGGL